MTFFESHFNIRLTEEVEEQIVKAMLKNPDMYESKAHFIRCAINYYLKNYEVPKHDHTTTTRRICTYTASHPSQQRQNERLRSSV